MTRWFGLALFMVLVAGHPALAQKEVLLGADNPGGSYYLYGGGLSTWINEHSKELRMTSQTTRGSVENARLINGGRLDFGLINAIATYQQRHGTGQFQGQQSDKARGVALLDTAPFHIVTYPSKGITKFADLSGKRVSIGAAGSGSATTANFLFPLAGLAGKVTVQNLGFSESATNLRDGNVDAFFAASALPLPAVVDLASTDKILLLDVPGDLIEALHKASPYYQRGVIPGGTYPGIANDVVTVEVASLLLAKADEPDDVVYELVSQMYAPASLDYMRSVYRAWSPRPAAEIFADIEIPMHPGALRYYREKGLIK